MGGSRTLIVKLLAYTPDADRVCAAAARSCYSENSSAIMADKLKDPATTLSHIVSMGHHSVIEHAVFTFSIEGVSRSLTHQLVRHRVASFSQQSQRYVSLNEPDYVVPDTIAGNPEAKALYDKLMADIWKTYNELENLGIDKEDARYVLPNACTTNITVTMNARELIHFFKLRCCTRAQKEIRDLADEMLKLCKSVSPAIFAYAGPSCVAGPCPEGEKSCGHSRRAEFLSMGEQPHN